ncbi:DMT family transporter [Motiliproteus sediminis]|uniref:DMT family transporter n=1 Tax=Motiliproteus sediminis TaxID=1468178 RepID=UPI001AEF824F|nr:DMT family transporter [Motiliproteus sediminis]
MAHLLLVLTTLFWSGNFVLARAMHLEIPPLSLALLRWSLAFVILAPWVLPALWRERQVLLTHYRMLLLLALLGVANFNTFVYLGVQHTTATNATLMQSAVPVVILLLSGLLGQPVRPIQLMGILLSLSGVLFIVTRGDWSSLLALALNPGDLWIMAAVLTWSLYTLCLRWRPQALSALALLGSTIGLGVAMLLPLFLWELGTGAHIQWSRSSVMVVGYVALFPSVLAYFFWNHGVSRLGAQRAGLYIHLMPVFGLLLSVLFLGESVLPFHLLGIGLIFAGIYLATGRQSRVL